MLEEDAKSLRAHGFDDRAIHDICTITAYFAFVNRVADGLGVELEGHDAPWILKLPIALTSSLRLIHHLIPLNIWKAALIRFYPNVAKAGG